MKKLKKCLLLLLACICILSLPVSASAATSTKATTTSTKKVNLKAPKPSKFKKYKKAPKGVTGAYFRSTWKKVKGASGYQAQYITYDGSDDEDGGFKYTKSTKKCQIVFPTSAAVSAKIRVRAYKMVKGKRVYGPFSKWVVTKSLW